MKTHPQQLQFGSHLTFEYYIFLPTKCRFILFYSLQSHSILQPVSLIYHVCCVISSGQLPAFSAYTLPLFHNYHFMWAPPPPDCGCSTASDHLVLQKEGPLFNLTFLTPTKNPIFHFCTEAQQHMTRIQLSKKALKISSKECVYVNWSTTFLTISFFGTLCFSFLP